MLPFFLLTFLAAAVGQASRSSSSSSLCLLSRLLQPLLTDADAAADADGNIDDGANADDNISRLVFVFSLVILQTKLCSLTRSQLILIMMILLTVDGPQYVPCHSNCSTMILVIIIV